ncbi:zinc ribbon domain-containing protein [Psychrobacillus sp.]|uniref:zinc ribbon domain-containing protein n=1 Tax=Psychrobacillus sp. TaxID=1871623 RepID=UPI0028BF562B|nr:zinc ribbon domain-containing protein [Psychrobacillus sp.]
MQNNYKNCQSCGMPIKKDEKIVGTEANGTKSNKYCIHCYENGQFTMPNVTVDGMKEIVMDKMIEMKLPRFLAKLFTKNIPKLERWKS